MVAEAANSSQLPGRQLGRIYSTSGGVGWDGLRSHQQVSAPTDDPNLLLCGPLLVDAYEKLRVLDSVLTPKFTMDPLSLAASIAGLMGAAQQIYSLLGLIHASKNSPTALYQAQEEVQHVQFALQSLQGYLLHLDHVTDKRKRLICVDELIATISDAMLSFSAFDSLLSVLANLPRIQVALSWFKYSKDIDEHIARIQRHKASLTVMLNIIQW